MAIYLLDRCYVVLIFSPTARQESRETLTLDPDLRTNASGIVLLTSEQRKKAVQVHGLESAAVFRHFQTSPCSSPVWSTRCLSDRAEWGHLNYAFENVDVAGLGSKHSSVTCAEHTDWGGLSAR